MQHNGIGTLIATSASAIRLIGNRKRSERKKYRVHMSTRYSIGRKERAYKSCINCFFRNREMGR